jgi:ABC-type oligopeptide transport system substrate-binding subunit
LSRRVTASLALLAAGVGLAIAAAAAAPASGGSAAAGVHAARGGTLRVDLRNDFDFIDPALAYFSQSWQMEYATTCKLLNFPDKEAKAGGNRITPEVATSLPAVSKDGKTYTFNLRKTFRFADGSPVTAQNFAYAINRDLQPRMSSPATTFVEDVVGARAVLDGKAQTASGVKAIGKYKLRVTLTRIAPDFLARITMPFFSAVRSDLPVNPDGIPASQAKGASCGAYYIDSWTQGREAVLKRNTAYRGTRPHNPDQITYSLGISLDAQRLRIEANQADVGAFQPNQAAELRDRYGVNKSHTGTSPSFYVRPNPVFWFLNMNTAQPLFKNNVQLRKAVNYAIDRPQMVRQHGALAGTRTDQIVPVGLPGFKDWNLYPLKGANYAKANTLAKGHTRGGKCEFWTFNSSFGPTVAQVVQFNLSKIGLNCNITPLDRVVESTRAGVKGAQYDLLLNGWGADYPDPYDFVNILLSGTSIQPENNVNLSYFNEAGWNKRMASAAKMAGQARYDAYAKIDRDLMTQAAPLAPYIDTNARVFVSKRVGCYVYSQVYGTDLGAACLS